MAIDKIVRNIIEDQAVTQPKIAAGAVDNAAVNTSIITGLTELTSVAENDQLIIHDTSAGALKKVAKSNTTSLDFPTFSNISPDNSQTADGGNITFTITGTGFTAGTNARLISNTGVRLNFDTVTRTNTTTISATIARSSLLVAQSPYDIQVINGEGLSVIGQNKIDIDTTPLFITSAGSLGSPVEGDSVDVEVVARDPDSSSAITFEIQSGSLPAGLSLVNQSGDSCRITGTASAVTADTTSNFTLRAFDSASNATSRAFSITVLNFNPAGVRFDSASSDYLSRTNTGAGNRRTFTYSFWYKRSNLGTDQRVIEASTDSSGNYVDALEFTSDDIRIVSYHNSDDIQLVTDKKFRDPSAWYHIVVAFDTTQATDTNRVKLYVNGVQETSFSTTNYPSQNFDTYFNNNSDEVYIGRRIDNGGSPSGEYLNGYLSEFVLIDGLQLSPTSFGETDSNGVWIPKNVSSLTFGTNGFYLPFDDGADLGDDHSGNTNDFTENNLTSIDAVEDTPVNNFATLNPLRSIGGNVGTYSEGNTIYTAAHADWQGTVGTIGSTAGKWYWEYKLLGGTYHINGIVSDIAGANAAVHDAASVVGGFGGYIDNGSFHARFDESDISGWDIGSVGVTFTTNDIVNVALDMDNKFLYFGKNGTWMKSGDPTSGATGTGGIDIGTPYDTAGLFAIPAVSIYFSGASGSINFGNPTFTISSGNADGNGYGNFEYAVPSGYFALNTKNLAQYG